MKTFKNPISTAMSEYREDFRYNREWWIERMGNGNNNEYLWIQFKNGDNITVQADYFQMDGNTCLPRFRADEVAYISRYFGDQCETTTAADIVVDTDRIILYADGVEYFRYEMSETEYKEMRRQMWELDDETDFTAWELDYCRALATSKMNNNGNTENTMKVNNTLNISDLASWCDYQLSTILDGISAGYTLGNYNTVWIDRGATVFRVSLATGEEIEIDSDNYTTAEEIAKAIISALNSGENEHPAPAFEELSHGAMNIALTANNSGDIYRRHIAPLVAPLAKKHQRGVKLNPATLSESGVMAAIIRDSIKEMTAAGWDESVTTNDRK